MGKLIVSLEGVVIKDVQLTKDKTTLGRRPYNDIVIDNLAVSGEHAVLQMAGADVFIEDLNSTNGTYINGKAVKKQLLNHNDTVEIGKYKIKYLLDDGTDYEKTQVFKADGPSPNATHGFTPSSLGAFSGSVTAGLDSRPERRCRRSRNGADQGRHHRWQTRRTGRVDHQAANRISVCACRWGDSAAGQWSAAGRRNRAAERRRCDRVGWNADAVRADLNEQHGRPTARRVRARMGMSFVTDCHVCAAGRCSGQVDGVAVCCHHWRRFAAAGLCASTRSSLASAVGSGASSRCPVCHPVFRPQARCHECAGTGLFGRDCRRLSHHRRSCSMKRS